MNWFRPKHPQLAAFAAALPGSWRRPHPRRDHFWVIDMEFDQLDARTGHILSVAAIRIEAGVIWLEKSLYLRVAQPEMNAGAIHIHGFRPMDAVAGVSEAEMLIALLEGGQGAYWVGHQPSLDRAFLQAAMQRVFGEQSSLPFIDTLKIALRADGFRFSREGAKAADYQLETLCRRYHLPHPNPHTAAGDAYATALLLLKLLLR